jgi:hypothetical protein
VPGLHIVQKETHLTHTEAQAHIQDLIVRAMIEVYPISTEQAEKYLSVFVAGRIKDLAATVYQKVSE